MKRLRILMPIVVTLAVLVSMLGTAVPVMASEITLAKNTDPISPNIYRIGDTINYVLTVSNPVTNTATNTLDVVQDILPDGTTVTLATNVVQEPGDSNTYYLDYVVDVADLQFIAGAWMVVNTLKIGGTDSLGDIINATTGKSSVVIQPAIDLEKYVNGEDADTPTGPSIVVGDPVLWEYIVTNTGDVDLTNVEVTDDILGLIGTIPSLAVGETQTLTANGTAAAGQYANLGTATGTPPVGPDVSDEDPSHYLGVSPSIDIEKHTNGENADNPTGPSIVVGAPVLWEYIVTNTGDVDLTNVVVTDDILGPIGTIPSLAAGETQTLTANGNAAAGQYANLGTATGTPPVGPDVSDEDPSHYLGEGEYSGLTPGFWKNHTDLWVDYTPGQFVGDVFDIPAELSDLADDTLLEALAYKGGKDAIGMARNLLRQAVAALLNASHPLVNYPTTVTDIITDTNDALATLDRDAMEVLKDQFDMWNNLEGGIDAHGNPL